MQNNTENEEDLHAYNDITILKSGNESDTSQFSKISIYDQKRRKANTSTSNSECETLSDNSTISNHKNTKSKSLVRQQQILIIYKQKTEKIIDDLREEIKQRDIQYKEMSNKLNKLLLRTNAIPDSNDSIPNNNTENQCSDKIIQKHDQNLIPISRTRSQKKYIYNNPQNLLTTTTHAYRPRHK